MINDLRFYRMLDDPKATSKPCIETPFSECKSWNEKNYGIFWTMNKFKGNRIKSNLEKINVWSVDIDDGTKEEQKQKIKSGLVPSLVIETKRGYQIYFMAKDAEEKYFKHIMLDRLIPFYNGDKNAADVSRVLRVPTFYHCKDPNDKFLVKKVYERAKSIYTQKIICTFYPDVNKDKRMEFTKRQSYVAKDLGEDASVWDRIYNLDHMEALETISGAPEVNGETFSFKPVSRGRHNVFVNGKGTSCFIDEFNRIGSLDDGGPCITNFLYWYHKDWKQVMCIMRKYFPNVFVGEKNARREV